MKVPGALMNTPKPLLSRSAALLALVPISPDVAYGFRTHDSHASRIAGDGVAGDLILGHIALGVHAV